MSENMTNSKKIGNIIRDGASVEDADYMHTYGKQRGAFLRIRLWERARDLAKTDNKTDLVAASVDILDLLQAIVTEEDGISFFDVVTACDKINELEGGYTTGLVRINRVKDTFDDIDETNILRFEIE